MVKFKAHLFARPYSKRNFKLIVGVGIVATSLGFVSCSSGPKTGEKIKPPKGIAAPDSSVITTMGENRRARFKDNDTIVFTSRDRLKHKSWQAYERNLKTSQERRLTYHDGDVFDVIWIDNKKRYFYSSTTDEQKEVAPNAPDGQQIENLPATEVYLADDLGEDISRVTVVNKFDGDLDAHPKSGEFIFVSLRAGTPYAYVGKFLGSAQARTPKRFSKEVKSESHPRYSPNGNQVIWVVHNDKNKSEIRLRSLTGKKNETVLVSSEFQNLDPSWHPNGKEILFVSNREDDNLELYAIQTDGTCLRRLTFHTSEDREPVVSPDGSAIVFSSFRTGVWQIHGITGQLPPCP